MEPSAHIDAAKYSFDEFMAFVFGHDVVGEVSKKWYWNTDLTFDPRQVCAYYVQLFRKPEILLERFPKPQLEEGFWAMISGVDWSLPRLLWETEIPFSLREECVRAMFDLFSHFFATEPLDSSCQMWGDGVCYDWHCGNKLRERDGEDSEMQDVMFQTLADILFLDSQFCQTAALHGLGHLHHPETQGLIQRYFTDHPFLTEAQKEYALAAAKF